jgi:hypothetical protein
MSEQDEIERLRRLREQQIGARDPAAKARRHYEIVGHRPRPTFSLMEEIKLLPAKVTWIFYGAVIGLIVGFAVGLVVDMMFQFGCAGYIAIFLMLWGGVVGRILGKARDSGREDWQ